MASIIGHRNRGSERPVAHTQQKLNQVAPRAFLIQIETLFNYHVYEFLYCLHPYDRLLTLCTFSFGGQEASILAFYSLSDLHVPYRSESMTVVQ